MIKYFSRVNHALHCRDFKVTCLECKQYAEYSIPLAELALTVLDSQSLYYEANIGCLTFLSDQYGCAHAAAEGEHLTEREIARIEQLNLRIASSPANQ